MINQAVYYIIAIMWIGVTYYIIKTNNKLAKIEILLQEKKGAN